MNWSQQQEAIFRWFEQPTKQHLVVRARAGTGKTTTIIEAVRHIGMYDDFDSGWRPARVLVCAFNKRIQVELQARLAGAADAQTLHALGYKFLRGAWGDLNVDNEVEEERIEKAAEESRYAAVGLPWDVTAAIKKLIGVAKGAAPFGGTDILGDLAMEHGCEVDSDTYGVDFIADIAHEAMAAALTPDPAGRITFDDMLFVPVVNCYAMPLYDWVIVDEAQDMNASQLLLARAAVRNDGHIVVVGDDRQAIYGFRGADSTALDRLKQKLDAAELGLNTTYRCPRTVVEAAQKLVADFFAPADAHEGAVESLSIDDLPVIVDPGDCILSRTNAPLVPLCLTLIRSGKPARIEGRDIGKMLAQRAKKLKATSVEDFMLRLQRWARTASGRALARGRNVEKALEQIRDVEATLAALAEDAETVQDIYARCERMFADNEGNREAMVVLSTVHKAKGLEWRRVFLLEGTLYVYGRRMEDTEEVNIHYVAVTRAKETLVMVRGQHAAA